MNVQTTPVRCDDIAIIQYLGDIIPEDAVIRVGLFLATLLGYGCGTGYNLDPVL